MVDDEPEVAEPCEDTSDPQWIRDINRQESGTPTRDHYPLSRLLQRQISSNRELVVINLFAFYSLELC